MKDIKRRRMARRVGHPAERNGSETNARVEDRLQHRRFSQRVRRVGLLGRHPRGELASR